LKIYLFAEKNGWQKNGFGKSAPKKKPQTRAAGYDFLTKRRRISGKGGLIKMTQPKRKPGQYWTQAELDNLRRELIEDPVMTMEEKISWDLAIAKALGQPHDKSDLEGPPARSQRASAEKGCGR
jgi:hypothetical protein